MPIAYPQPPVAQCPWDPNQRVHFVEPEDGDLDEEDLEDDTELPEGWARIKVAVKVSNPGYAAETEVIKETLAEETRQMKAQLKQMAAQTGEKPSKSTLRDARQARKAQLEASRSEPRYVVEVIEEVCSPEHVPQLLAVLQGRARGQQAAPQQAAPAPQKSDSAPWAS